MGGGGGALKPVQVLALRLRVRVIVFALKGLPPDNPLSEGRLSWARRRMIGECSARGTDPSCSGILDRVHAQGSLQA